MIRVNGTGTIMVDSDPLELVTRITLRCLGEIYQEKLYPLGNKLLVKKRPHSSFVKYTNTKQKRDYEVGSQGRCKDNIHYGYF